MRTEDAQQPNEQEIKQRQVEVRELAQKLWDTALIAADRHPYSLLWGVNTQRLKVYRGDLVIDCVPCDGALVMPMRDTAGTVWNAGFITAVSTIRFLPGGRVANTYFGWGADRSTIVVCRSFAKAAEINTATGHAVAVAFTAGNLENVVGIMRDRYPQAHVVLATDFQFASQRRRGEAMTNLPGAAVLGGLSEADAVRPAPKCSQTPERSQLALMKTAPVPVAALAADRRITDALHLGALTEFPDAKKLLDWIRRKGLAEFTKKNVMQLGPSRVRNVEAAKAALLTLVEHGWLTTEDANRFQVTPVAGLAIGVGMTEGSARRV